MQIAVICELLTNKPVGIVGKDNDNIGFISNSNELNEILDYIIDKNDIELTYNENLNNNNLLRVERFNINSENYFIGLNYILPDKWKILGLTKCEEDMPFNDSLKNIFNVLMEGDLYEK